MRILLIDNNDSFTRNLEHLLAAAIKDARIVVVSYDKFNLPEPNHYDLVVISPGPGTPADYPGYEHIIDSGQPVLGICLGMQLLNEHFGGETARLEGCVHGKTDSILWNGRQETVARYHSLHVSRVGDGLEVLSQNEAGVPMALGNKAKRVMGYQFHPESFMTENGGTFIVDELAYLGL